MYLSNQNIQFLQPILTQWLQKTLKLNTEFQDCSGLAKVAKIVWL